MEISREQAANFGNYDTLGSDRELGFFIMMPSFFNDTQENFEQHRLIFHDDVQIKHDA